MRVQVELPPKGPLLTKRDYEAKMTPFDKMLCAGEGLKEAQGSWPTDCLQRAFVEGAKWWEYEYTKTTMWQEDQRKAEQAAIDKYGIPKVY